MKNWDEIKKLENNIKLHEELHQMYCLISKLAIVCLKKGLPLIIENPYSEEHYLTRYWSVRATIIDTDRRLSGDNFKKPTQFFFIGREPSNNLVFEAVKIGKRDRVIYCSKVERSMIAPEYANRFIREFII